ncbi:putative superfamily III holin-X [Motilibacter peucedani]|uniref:Putative superfamily III holin-X n=1 Tax=Motilibacter peucedani TaxID=598650 RepID=A0A420XR29_9ACTN|nr:phage holin family protein [Motilibacter peucedani]RKS75684.1 putative superfamily III holin-X [Motilibacter peucedani]
MSDVNTGATRLENDRPQVVGDAAASPGSLGQLFTDVTKDLSTLVRQEVALAKAELKQDVSQAGKGAGMLGGAGLAGHFVLLFVSLAAWWGLANVMDEAWAALIVAVVWGVIGAVLALMGKAQLSKVKGMKQTQETVKEIPPTLKPGTGH